MTQKLPSIFPIIKTGLRQNIHTILSLMRVYMSANVTNYSCGRGDYQGYINIGAIPFRIDCCRPALEYSMRIINEHIARVLHRTNYGIFGDTKYQ